MQKLIRRIERIVSESKSFGYAVANVAKDIAIDIGVCEHVAIDIVDILPSVENVSVTQFRLAIVTAIVRSFDPQHNDTSKVPYFRAMYDKFCDMDLLTSADMQTYNTMMFLLHPQPAGVGEYLKKFGA